MKSYVIRVSGKGEDIKGAFAETERVAALAELDEKQAKHLRLLTEEMMSLLRSVTGSLDASFWIEWEEKAFALHLSAEQKLGNVQRQELINSTSDKVNDAAKSFLGKLREIFEEAMSVQNDIANYYSIAGASSTADISDEIIASKKWDGFERSVLLSLADHVGISIKGGEVNLTITKKY